MDDSDLQNNILIIKGHMHGIYTIQQIALLFDKRVDRNSKVIEMFAFE